MAEGNYKTIEEIYFLERDKSLDIFSKIYLFLAKILPKIPIINEKDKKELEKILDELYLDIEPEKILSIQLFSFLFFIIYGFLIFLLPIPLELKITIIFLSFFLLYFFIYYPYNKYRKIRRLKENQFPLAIFYIASYMRMESNLENAIKFSIMYLPYPLKLDFLKILWEVETKKYSSIYEAIDKFLSRWIDESPYFVESMELLVSTLFEENPVRRDIIFDRAVETFVNGVQIKMQSYIRSIKGPIEAIYMMGLVLPLLTISLFPILSIFLAELFSPYLLFGIYDVIIPLTAFFFGYKYLSNRPGFSLYEDEYIREIIRKNKKVRLAISILVGAIVFLILSFVASLFFPSLLEYQLIPLLYSVLVILIFGISISVAFRYLYKGLEKCRKRVVTIVNEMPFAIYQLSNRLGEGMPPERAFYKIYEYMPDKEIGKFSYLVYKNIMFGRDLESAIFDKKEGAIVKYPSSLLKSVMSVLIESSRKGVETASKSLSYIFQYLIKLKQVDERLKDMLGDVTSSMKVLVSFMAPLMIGLIVGLTVMLMGVLVGFSKITSYFISMQGVADISAYLPIDILTFFSVKRAIPPMVIQFIIGIYLIELTAILAFFLNRIENGYDEIEEKRYLSSYILKATLFYSIVCGISSVFLWNLAMLIYYLL